MGMDEQVKQLEAQINKFGTSNVDAIVGMSLVLLYPQIIKELKNFNSTERCPEEIKDLVDRQCNQLKSEMEIKLDRSPDQIALNLAVTIFALLIARAKTNNFTPLTAEEILTNLSVDKLIKPLN